MTDDSTSDLTVRILRQMQADFTEMKQQFAEQRTDIASLRSEMRERFDNLVFFMGGRYRDHETRISALEATAHTPKRPRR